MTTPDIEIQTNRMEALAQQLNSMLYPDAILPCMFQTICDSLNVPYVAIHIDRSDTNESTLVADFMINRDEPMLWHDEYESPVKGRAPSVELSSQCFELPLSVASRQVGRLIIDTLNEDQPIDVSARNALATLAQSAGVAIQIVRMTYDLRRIRERLVLAREEERRQLRRNLHDDIGPTLAALNLRAGSVRKLIVSKPSDADAQMGELREQIRQVITEIRRVIYNLRPPALDELGLLPAILEQARQFSLEGLIVMVDAPVQLPQFSAAVEVAVYRIFSEAVTNVFRHAEAQNCWVRLKIEDQSGTGILTIEVEDDGKGISQDSQAGVGLMSMQERTAELGGACTIDSKPSHGTVIRAELPLESLAGYASDLAAFHSQTNNNKSAYLL